MIFIQSSQKETWVCLSDRLVIDARADLDNLHLTLSETSSHIETI